MHPVLFHIGALLIPSYGAVSALGVLLGLLLAARPVLAWREQRKQRMRVAAVQP